MQNSISDFPFQALVFAHYCIDMSIVLKRMLNNMYSIILVAVLFSIFYLKETFFLLTA